MAWASSLCSDPAFIDYGDALLDISLGLEKSSHPGQFYWAIRASVVSDGYDTLGFGDLAIGLAL